MAKFDGIRDSSINKAPASHQRGSGIDFQCQQDDQNMITIKKISVIDLDWMCSGESGDPCNSSFWKTTCYPR